jgi:serine/threonine protein kinase
VTTQDTTVLGGRYALAELLGRGGMADVYRAEDRLLERGVAVKVLRTAAPDAADDQRFRAEARTLANLEHPHVVSVLDAGRSELGPYLVLELVEGSSLSHHRGRAMDPRLVAAMGRDIADALAYVHRRGIVHRDIKPGNILLDERGEVRLTDFGIARLLSDPAHHTATGATVGTAAYLSPEQVRGAPVTPAADIYALGLVLLEALTGERIYSGAPIEAALARLHRPPEVPTSLPQGWDAALSGMLTAEPEDRSTAVEVAHRMAALARGEQVLAKTMPRPATTGRGSAAPAGSAAHRARRPARRRRRVLVTVLCAVLVGGAAVTVTARSSHDPDLPDGVPTNLRQPLTDLHSAVDS